MNAGPNNPPGETLQVGVEPVQEFVVQLVAPTDPHPIRFGRPPRPAPEDLGPAAGPGVGAPDPRPPVA